MTNTDVVEKLIGKINPVGESNTDEERFNNLQEMCKLVNELVTKIDDVVVRHQNDNAYSIKRSADYAKNFLTNTLGIVE